MSITSPIFLYFKLTSSLTSSRSNLNTNPSLHYQYHTNISPFQSFNFEDPRNLPIKSFLLKDISTQKNLKRRTGVLFNEDKLDLCCPSHCKWPTVHCAVLLGKKVKYCFLHILLCICKTKSCVFFSCWPCGDPVLGLNILQGWLDGFKYLNHCHCPWGSIWTFNSVSLHWLEAFEW